MLTTCRVVFATWAPVAHCGWVTGDWELYDAPQESDRPDELDTGHESQRPRWLTPLVRTVVGLVAVAVVVSLVQAGRRPGPKPSAKAAPSTSGVATSRPMTDQELALATIRDQAYDPLGSSNVINANTARGTCKDLRVGDKPEPRLAAAVRRALPGYVVNDTSRAIDQLAALCTVGLRAHGPEGTILVLRVISPPEPAGTRPGLEHGADGTGTVFTSYVRDGTADGWTIIAGATGPRSSQPSYASLLQLVQDTALRW